MSAEPVLTAESVRALPAELKRQLFALLARELVGPSGTVSVADGEVTVYAAGARALTSAGAAPALTPDQEMAVRAAIATPADTFDMDEFLNELSRENPG